MVYEFEQLKSFSLRPFRCYEAILVDIIEGDSDRVEILAGDKDYKKLIFDVSKDALEISAHRFALLRGLKIIVYAKGLESIKAAGKVLLTCGRTAQSCKSSLSGSVRASYRMFSGGSMGFLLAGTVTLDMDSSLDALEITAAGSSKIRLAGVCTAADFKTSGATRVSAEELACRNITINSSGASRYALNVSETLGITISGSGRVKYFGNPAITHCRISGSISVNKLD